MVFSADIFQAAQNGYISEVERYINNGIDINSTDRKGITPLCRAIDAYPLGSNSSQNMVEFLVKNGADINFIDSNGLTPLHRSVMVKANEISQFMLRKGAKKELPAAILTGDRNYFDNYVITSKDVNSRLGIYTPLQWIAYCGGSPDMAAVLIENGADINARDSVQGRTSLHFASFFGYEKIVEFLLLNKADQNIQDFENKTALHVASEQNNICVLRLLIDHGSDLELRCGVLGFTALYFAESPEVRDYLHSQGLKKEMYAISRLILFLKDLFMELLRWSW